MFGRILCLVTLGIVLYSGAPTIVGTNLAHGQSTEKNEDACFVLVSDPACTEKCPSEFILCSPCLICVQSLIAADLIVDRLTDAEAERLLNECR